MAASRLKGKPLLEINNVPIICHVLNKAMETGLEAFVATEDKEIVTAIEQNYAGKVILTGNHKTGTDRIFEAFKKLKIENVDYILNLQGDEPMIEPEDIRNLNNIIYKSQSSIGTLACKIKNEEHFQNENIVKVITESHLDNQNFPLALKFQRKVNLNENQNVSHRRL